MATIYYTSYSYALIELPANGDIHVFTTAAIVGVDTDWVVLEGTGRRNNQVIVRGLLDGGDTVGLGGIQSNGKNFELDIAGTGIVRGGIGVLSNGLNADLDNQGYIFATLGDGVIGTGNGFSLRNGGFIQGSDGVYVSGDDITIVNQSGALIDGDHFGINILSAAGSQTRTVNHGVVLGRTNYGYNAGESDDTLINDGRITGSVEMRGGDDYLDNRGGTIIGSLTGGAGDDEFITDDGNYFYGGTGLDVVRTSAAYTLISTTEWLELLGNANVNGMGNAGVNRLWGNAGNNRLSGVAGNDHLTGRGGNDALFGGADSDVFVFSNGFDRDRIRDFSIQDKIDVSSWAAISSFADLKNNHAENHGGDVWIVAGTDILIIEGLVVADLKAAYFDI